MPVLHLTLPGAVGEDPAPTAPPEGLQSAAGALAGHSQRAELQRLHLVETIGTELTRHQTVLTEF